jgi:hypothetical protein
MSAGFLRKTGNKTRPGPGWLCRLPLAGESVVWKSRSEEKRNPGRMLVFEGAYS